MCHYTLDLYKTIETLLTPPPTPHHHHHRRHPHHHPHHPHPHIHHHHHHHRHHNQHHHCKVEWRLESHHIVLYYIYMLYNVIHIYVYTSII